MVKTDKEVVAFVASTWVVSGVFAQKKAETYVVKVEPISHRVVK